MAGLLEAQSAHHVSYALGIIRVHIPVIPIANHDLIHPFCNRPRSHNNVASGFSCKLMRCKHHQCEKIVLFVFSLKGPIGD